jgi:preprotein translocase subunit YajC
MFSEFTDVVPSFFGWLNQGPMTLTIFLHVAIVIPMFWIYKQEKAKLEEEQKKS